MSRIPWRFADPVTSDVYYLPVNPLDDNCSGVISKQTKYEVPVSTYVSKYGDLKVDDVVAQDAPSEIRRFSYKGTLYTRGEYMAFMEWFSKPYEWELRDDLGREFLVFAESFEPERQRSAKFVWKHSYVIAGIIIRELGV